MSPPAMKPAPAPVSTTTPEPRLALDPLERVRQAVDHLRIERVQHLRPVQRHRGDRILDAQQHRVIHGETSRW